MATTLTHEFNLPSDTDDSLTFNEHQPESDNPIKSAKKIRSIRTPDTLPDFNHCEFYSRVEGRAVRLYGEWMPQAGFINGMPVKIRVMKDCIVITPQNTRELWGCIEGLSVAYINQRKVKEWLKNFPGAMNNTGDMPVIKRGR